MLKGVVGMMALIGLLTMAVLTMGAQARIYERIRDPYFAFRPNDDRDIAAETSGRGNEVDDNGPPPYTEYAKMARYLVHKAEWVSMGSLSTVEAIKGYPMVNIIAVADSARGAKSTGTLYFYLTMLDYTAQDLAKDNRLTVLLSMDQDLDCTKRDIDPMEPTCARIMISGRAVKLQEGTDDFRFGKDAMFSRHPAAKHWLDTHNFFLCKLDIVQIAVLDYYGGPHYVTLEEYMNANPDETSRSLNLIDAEQPEIVQHNDNDRTITIKFKKNSPVHNVNLEI